MTRKRAAYLPKVSLGAGVVAGILLVLAVLPAPAPSGPWDPSNIPLSQSTNELNQGLTLTSSVAVLGPTCTTIYLLMESTAPVDVWATAPTSANLTNRSTLAVPVYFTNAPNPSTYVRVQVTIHDPSDGLQILVYNPGPASEVTASFGYVFESPDC